MRFEIRAYANGQISSLFVDAISEADALHQVTTKAFRPLTVRRVDSSVGRWFGKPNPRFKTLLFCQELLALLEAGLSVIEAVDTLADRERRPEAQSILGQLGRRLREGLSLSGALESLPEAFAGMFVGIVRSAERTGNLPEALTRYIDYRNRVDNLRTRVISAAIYPALLLIVGIAVSLFLGGYVVPRFAAVYQGTGRSLPWASALLLDWGDLANRHAHALLAVLIALLMLGSVGIRVLNSRGGITRLLRSLPIFADHVRTYELSRLYLTLGMLLESGLPIMRAQSLAQEALPLHLRTSLESAAVAIRRGERISDAFDRTGLATTIGLRMLRIGEESGRLGEMMARTARFHEDETARWIDRFSRTAEPLLMVAIGLVIGTIVVLLYMPIFDLAGSLQ